MQKNICIPKISSSLEFPAHAYTIVKGLYDLKLDDLFDIPCRNIFQSSEIRRGVLDFRDRRLKCNLAEQIITH